MRAAERLGGRAADPGQADVRRQVRHVVHRHLQVRPQSVATGGELAHNQETNVREDREDHSSRHLCPEVFSLGSDIR